MKISTKYSFYNKHSFSQFEAYFVCRSKIMTYCKVFQKLIFGTRPSIKKIKGQQSAEKSRHFLEDSGLNRVSLGLRQVYRSYVSDSVEVLSALIIIAQTSLFKSLLPFITFVNYKNAYLLEKLLHILFSYFAFSKKKKQKRSLLKQ